MINENLILPIILQLAGVVVIIAEIILPSGGLLSVMAALLFGYSLYQVFTVVSVAAGACFVAADIILIPILVITGLKLLAKSPVTLRRELSSEDGVTSQSPEMETYMGKAGVALTDLRPAGAARISGKRLDVVTRGDYLDKGAEIIVYKIEGNQIIVNRK
jgi:membrane-bound ClpP family serine protease